MMGEVGNIGKLTNFPTEIDGANREDHQVNTWGEMPGKVVSFDKDKQTMTVQPLYKPRHNGKAVDMPELQEVPTRFPRIGGFVVTGPVKEGDHVTLRPQMRNTEAYHNEDGSFEADSVRMNSLSDYEAYIDGGESLKKPISNFNNNNFEIRSEDGQFAIEFSEDGKFRLKGATGDAFDLLAQTLELMATDTLVIAYGSSAGSGHQLQWKNNYAEIAGKLRAMSLEDS